MSMVLIVSLQFWLYEVLYKSLFQFIIIIIIIIQRK